MIRRVSTLYLTRNLDQPWELRESCQRMLVEGDVPLDVTIARLGAKSVTYGVEFSRAGEVLARGKITSACCRVGPEHRLEGIPIPASYRQRLEA